MTRKVRRTIQRTSSSPSTSPPGGPTPDTHYRLQNVTSGLQLDSGGSTTGGSPVKQWPWTDSTNLRWHLVPA